MSLQLELRRLYRNIGEPGYRVLRQQAELNRKDLPPQTITTLLNGDARPRWRTVITFVEACRRFARANRCTLPAELLETAHWEALYAVPVRPLIDIWVVGEHFGQYCDAVVEVCQRLGLDPRIGGTDGSAVVLLLAAPGTAPSPVRERSVPLHEYVLDGDDIDMFRAAVLRDLAALRRPDAGGGVALEAGGAAADYYAVPAYVYSQPFTGRQQELDTLDRWAAAPEPVLVVEAIGGVGKSALTWTWFQERAPGAIDELAGRLWWSFYEGSASMVKFLRCAVGFLTGADRDQCADYDQEQLFDLTMSALQERPYLLVLDGLERLLAAYHRFDPAALRDEDVDVNARRVVDPFAADVLRAFAGLTRSKVLVSSRLMPDVLTGPARHPLRGVRLWPLPGLAGDDVVKLLGRLGVVGHRARMEDFFGLLGNHPLLIGAVAGLIRDHRPAPGSFDAWIDDVRAGGGLRLADLALSQRRTHVLAAAFAGLRTSHRNTLGCIAILPAPVRFATMLALDPVRLDDEALPDEDRRPADLADLDRALRDLEQRGLLMWDRASNTYDLHPIVRAFAIDQFETAARAEANERVRDHFQALPAEDVELAASVEDLSRTTTIFRAMLGCGMRGEAEQLYDSRLAGVLYWQLAAHTTVIELLEPFDNAGVAGPALHSLANAYSGAGRHDDALRIEIALVEASLRVGGLDESRLQIGGRRVGWLDESRLQREGLLGGGLDESLLQSLADELGATGQLAADARLGAFMQPWMRPSHRPAYWFGRAVSAYRRGALADAEAMVGAARDLLDKLPETPRPTFVAELSLLAAEICWRNGADVRSDVEAIRRYDGVQLVLPDIARLLHDMALSAPDLDAALVHADQWLRACRNQGVDTLPVRAAMARTHARAGRVTEALTIAEEAYAGLAGTFRLHRPYAMLGEVFAAGGDGRAVEMAECAYRQAWCDGPPYTLFWPLQDARRLLTRLGVAHPDLPVTDPEAATFPLEPKVRAVLEGRPVAWATTDG